MTVLWCILGSIVLLLIIALTLRVGITVTMAESLTVTAHIGPKTIPIYPAVKKREKPSKKKEEPAAASPGKKTRPKPDLTSQEIREAIRAAWKAIERVLQRVGRRIRIAPCEMSIVVGGPQPDRVAELYGQVSGAVWTVMPRLEQLIHIRQPYIHIDVDFNAPAVNVEGRLGAYLRVGDLFAIAFAAAVPLLKWYIPFRRHQKMRQKAAACAVQSAAQITQP